MRRRNKKGLLAVILVLCVLAAVCIFASRRMPGIIGVTEEEMSLETEEASEPEPSVEIAEVSDINDMGINEDKSVYDEDDLDSIVYFYVTVREGDKGSETDHTFDEVKSAVRFIDNSHAANDVFARALVQIGDETGPKRGMIGFGETKTNATIRVRGNSSSVMPQKSYQLKLDSEAGLWRGQRNLALNKSAFDLTKFRNKLYFDMLKDVEDVPSIRTQFARLFIKDETSGATEYEDYGFYTQAEVPNKRYLANHGLDRENYITWLAYNILVANIDTTVQNFYLYSPTNSNKWYFIPWDGDNMLPWKEYELEGSADDYGGYEIGVSNYWGVILHQRFLKYEENREELAAKIEELHSFINKETVDEKVQEYNQIVEPWISQMPDLYYLGGTLEERQQLLSGLGDEIETAYDNFYKSLESLMPFFLQPMEQDGESLVLNWDEAYDFDNEEIRYHVLVSEYPDMRSPLIDEEVEGVRLETTKDTLPEGTYYWTVEANTESGRSWSMTAMQVPATPTTSAAFISTTCTGRLTKRSWTASSTGRNTGSAFITARISGSPWNASIRTAPISIKRR